jgi:hypothetical protein
MRKKLSRHLDGVVFTLLMCLMALCDGCQQCSAETYPLITSYQNQDGTFEDKATAVCIAHTDRGCLLVTAGHNVRSNPASVWISNRQNWIHADRVHIHPTEDLAVVELPARLDVTPLGDATPIGQQVTVQGYGPRLNDSGEPFAFRAMIDEETKLRGINGEHVIPGDSGGPMLYDTESGPALVGVVIEHEGSEPATRRKQFARYRARSGFVPAETIVSFVQSQYGGCPNGVCPIRIRPQIQQPMIGIGLPLGPPRIVDTIERIPQAHVIQSPQRIPLPNTVIPQQSQICPPGPPGRDGVDGRDGRSVTKADVEAVVNAWLDANREQLRGPAGPAGSSADVSQLERRLSAVESRPFRMVLTSDGTILDDETYAPGEPVVLDLKRLRNRSNGNE